MLSPEQSCTPNELACVHGNRVKVKFRGICSLMRMFMLGKCSVHEGNKGKNHATAKDKCIYLFSNCRPPSLLLIKKLRRLVPP